jgi:hypothetical protein
LPRDRLNCWRSVCASRTTLRTYGHRRSPAASTRLAAGRASGCLTCVISYSSVKTWLIAD